MCIKNYLVGLFLFDLLSIFMLHHSVEHSYGLKLVEGEYFVIELYSIYFAFYIW